MFRFSILGGLAAALCAGSAFAQSTWYVDATGTAPGTGTSSDPFARIDYAVAQPAVASGDTILVAPGDYSMEAIDFQSKELVLEATGGSAVTSIVGPAGSGQPIAPFMEITGGQTSATVIRGFEFRDFWSSSPAVSTLIELNGTSPAFESCRFENNYPWDSYVVSAQGGSPSFSFCHFEGNDGGVNGLNASLQFNQCYWTQTGQPIEVNGGSVAVTDCQLVDTYPSFCTLAACGGSLYANNATVTLIRVTMRSTSFPNGPRHMHLIDCQTAVHESIIEGADFAPGPGGGILATGGSLVCSASAFSRLGAERGGAVALFECQAFFQHCTFFDNDASIEDYDGGAIYAQGSQPLDLVDSRFEANLSGLGGAVAAHVPTSMIRCEFVDNVAIRGVYYDNLYARGGAVYATQAVQVDDCLFENNLARSFYPPNVPSYDVAYGGAVYMPAGSTIKNTTFRGNEANADLTAAEGGAVYTTGPCTIERSVFEDNMASPLAAGAGGAIAGNGTANHCTFVGNTSTGLYSCASGWNLSNSIVVATDTQPFDVSAQVTHSLITNGWPGMGNLSGDPGFWGESDFHLVPGSQAIDAGNPADPADPDGSIADMGAFPYSGDYCGPNCTSDSGWIYCLSTPNSTGQVGRTFLLGSTTASDNEFRLGADRLPAGQFGFFLIAPTTDFVPFFGGSQGHLCLGAPLLRWNDQIETTNLAGQVSRSLDLTSLPQGQTIDAGETWHFQFWHRDFVNGASTANTSSGLRASFH